MSYAQENGYTPRTFNQIMDDIRTRVNTVFNTSYTSEGFTGTGFYKFYYAPAQMIQSIDIKASEIFAKTSDYIKITNEKIQRPSVSVPGLYDSFLAKGYISSVKETEEADAGKISIAIDIVKPYPVTADYESKKADILKNISEFTCAGLFYTGTERGDVTLKNLQAHEFAYHLADRKPIWIRITVTKSRNKLISLPSDETIRKTIFDNIKANYRLGLDFEPQRYYNQCAADWAANIQFEWSDDATSLGDVGATWSEAVYYSDFDELFEVDLTRIGVTIV